MNVEVVARIRPPGRGEVTSINISGTRVESSNGTGHIFSTVYKPHVLTYDIYRESFLPLLDLFLAGYNVCVLAFGETGSGKSYTLAGERSAKAGLVPLLINGLFLKLKEQREKENKLQVQQGSEGQVVAQCFQVYNEKVTDLLGPSYEGREAEITEDATNGVIVKNITKKHVSDAAECTALFRQAMESRTHAQTDYGHTDNRSAVVFTLDLFREKSEVFHSRLLIAELPGAEKLAEDPTQLRMREGSSLNRPILAFRHLVSSLAASPTATRVINYSDSKLTLLLRDALGGNCKTKVIVNLKATKTPSLSTVLTLSGQLAQILNYPIPNGNMAQKLVTQYRAVILNLQEQLTLSGRRVGDTSMSKVQEYKDQLAKVSNENVKLQEGREQLYRRIIELEAKYTEATTSWKQLSSKLELSDEEKLQIYKNLVDLQLENNRIIEETAADKYELTNRILSLENQVSEFETAHDRNKRAADQANEELGVLQNEHGELSDEYLVLKTNHIHITNELQNEMSRNEELGLELVRLSSLKDRLQKDKETVEIETMQEYYSQLRKLASKFSRSSLREKNDMSKSLVSLRSENLQLEKQLLLSSNTKDGMVDVLKNEHRKELSRLADKINDLKMKLNQTQASQRESQRRLAGQSAELITTQADKRRVEEQNDKLDQQLKEVSAEYSNRLQQYIHDISVYCGQMSGQQVSLESLQAYIDAMVRKVRDAQEHRVVTLEERVKTLKAALAELSKKHGKLLSLHSVLRFDVESFKGTRIDENDTYLPTEEELENAQTLEVTKLTTKLCKYEQEIKDLKQQLSVATTKQEKIQDNFWMHSETTRDHSKHLVSDSSDINWNQLRKHLREFTLNTQQELESERASLMTRCIIAEEQITSLQEYIDTQLKRYLQEIARLKKKLGDSERANSADSAIVSNNYGALLGKRWGK